METIRIKGLEIFAYHGVNPEEKENGQRFVLDLAMTADLSRAAQVVCDAVLDGFPQVAAVTVELKKPEAPMNAVFDYVSVEMTRCRA